MKTGSNWCKLNLALQTSVAIGALFLSAEQACAQDAVNTAPANGKGSRGVQRALDDDDKDGKNSEIVVTGTHISGSESASPTYTISDQDFRRAGQSDLGEVLRSLPFNFSGGQNPGVMQGAVGISNANGTNASAPNLRGLGPDATLTLLNGHRLPYNGIYQSVDISSIPLAAVSTVQIVPDGASAIYGSDAVGGVVNILLRRDFRGVDTSATIGTTTQGGGFEQQYDVTGGTTWSSGGFMIAGQYGHQDPVRSYQREFTADLPRPADLLARSEQYSFLATGHQEITENLEFDVDGHYNRRKAYRQYAPSSTTTRYDNQSTDESYSISPSLTLKLPGSWQATASGTYGIDNNDSRAGAISIASGKTTYTITCNCNKTSVAEIGVAGPLVTIGGGAVDLAIGGGYREDQYESISRTSGSRSGGSRNDIYAYGEINIPLIGDANSVPGVRKLTLSGAARYEHYNVFGDVTTPKLGVIYSPVSGVELKGSWGKSFKVPTLLQMYQLSYVYLYPAYAMGRPDLPATTTVLMPYGGNPNLRPERSTNWSVTADIRPKMMPDLHFSVSYYNVNYRDRVIQPINIGTALSDPQYAQFITYNPSPALQAEIIGRTTNFQNLAGQDYDPAGVLAIAEDRYFNAVKQNIRGIDVNGEYKFGLGGGQMNLATFVSWIDSSQKISASSPSTDLAGIIFNPPSFRARTSASWTSKQISSAIFVNYIGPVKNNQVQPNVDGSAMVTVDLNVGASFRTGQRTDPDLRISISVQNLLDSDPPYARSLSKNYVSYDSTNYSAMGRIVSLTIGKKW
ncbi:TonB-dependent receptor domain-containing protein [Sphingomonas sp. YL-JM2C]